MPVAYCFVGETEFSIFQEDILTAYVDFIELECSSW